MSAALPELILHQLTEQFRYIPFFLLQAAALVGFFTLLLMFRGNKRISSPDSLVVGWVLGGSCFIMSFLLLDQMQPDLKLIIMADYIFVAGLTGGWRNALITFWLVLFTRFIFGGQVLFLAAVVDYVCVFFGSIVAHRLAFPQGKLHLSAKRFVFLFFWCFFLGELSPVLVAVLDAAPDQTTAIMIARRGFTLITISPFIITSIGLILQKAIDREARALVDSTSGLPNAQAFQSHLDALADKARKKESVLTVLVLVDIDNIIELRQTLGCSKLQALISTIGKELSETINLPAFASCNPALYSFPDYFFALILENRTKEDVQQEGLAQSLFRELCITGASHAYTLPASYTISVLDIHLQPDFDSTRFLRALMLLEKRDDENIRYLEPTIAQQVLLEERIFALISDSVSGGEVPVWLQPKVRLADSSCCGAEALMRVPGLKKGSYINPHMILVAAERHRLRQELEWGVVRSVVNCLSQLHGRLGHLKLSVNLTPEVFTVAGFSDQLIALLREKQIKPDRLILEIIETAKFQDTDAVHDNIKKLMKNGFCLSLDDFGTGYSSLTLLSRYRFQELKIDYSMTSNINNPRMYSAIQLSIESAWRYQASVVAEGIETEDQKTALQELGALYGQGYLFGKAMPLDEFIGFATKNLCPDGESPLATILSPGEDVTAFAVPCVLSEQ